MEIIRLRQYGVDKYRQAVGNNNLFKHSPENETKTAAEHFRVKGMFDIELGQ